MRKRMMRLAVVGALVITVAGAVPATAKDGDVRVGGACSAGSTWKLKLSAENGRIEVEYQVDSNVVGQAWRVRIVQDGQVIFLGKRLTKAPSGSFTVRLLTPNTAGSDAFRARARNLGTDEICAGGATFSA